MRRIRCLVWSWSLLTITAACVGDGSDIGPRLPRLPDASSKVVVLDDQGRGVVAATVSVVGTNQRAITGRNGRGDFLADPRGRVLLHVDGRAGAAGDADRLAELFVATTIVGRDVPGPIHLPDLPDAAAVALTAGTQASSTTVTSVSGSMLTIGAGVSVGTAAGAATIDLRLGDLGAEHLPGDLPTSVLAMPPTTMLFGRGLFVHPADASFTPAVDLDVADDLVADSTPVTLYQLDAATGEWQALGVAVTSAGGRLLVAGGVATGGLYAFGASTPPTTVSGRVVDAAGNGVPDVMVRVDQIRAITDGAGRFTADGVPATFADGSARQAAIELFAGGDWLPVIATVVQSVGTASVDVGDLTLDTLRAGNVRVQQIVRSRADALRPARLSSLLGSVALITTSDLNGQVFFEDVPAEFFGFQEGRRRNAIEVYYGQAIAFLEPGRRWLDDQQFLAQRRWFIGSRSTRSFVGDSIGGGPISGAEVVAGSVPLQGRAGSTAEGGTFFVDRSFGGRATASHRSEREGRSITHAISYVRPDSDHLEFPLQRVLRRPLGAFDRHGLVAGNLIGADPAREHALRVTRRITRTEWWDDLVDGQPIRSSLPIDVDPATTHGPFQAGLTTTGGHLAAIEFTMPGGVKTLQKIGLLTDFVPTEGEVVARDVPLEFEANATFDVVGALTGVDPMIDLGNLIVAVALEQQDDRVVDVARGLQGNYATAAGNLSFTLPQLAGSLAGNRWLALVQGDVAALNGTFAHASVIALPVANDPAQSPPVGFTFPSFPTVTAPAPDATVPAAGFTVTFALPPAAQFGTIELRQDTGTELLLWQVVVPQNLTEFAFVTLPVESDTPLVAGRTYTLTVSAWFGEVVTDSVPPYRDLIAWAQSIAPVEAGVTQVARRSIQITTN